MSRQWAKRLHLGMCIGEAAEQCTRSHCCGEPKRSVHSCVLAYWLHLKSDRFIASHTVACQHSGQAERPIGGAATMIVRHDQSVWSVQPSVGTTACGLRPLGPRPVAACAGTRATAGPASTVAAHHGAGADRCAGSNKSDAHRCPRAGTDGSCRTIPADSAAAASPGTR